MTRFLCRLGLHRWLYYHVHHRTCRRCGRSQKRLIKAHQHGKCGKVIWYWLD